MWERGRGEEVDGGKGGSLSPVPAVWTVWPALNAAGEKFNEVKEDIFNNNLRALDRAKSCLD